VPTCAAYPGTYKSEATHSCEQCDSTCETCAVTLNTEDSSAQLECLTCNNESYFFLGQCLPDCPETSVKLRSDVINACTLCNRDTAFCFTCEGDVNTCTSCVTGYFFLP
jgi:hypothetical protein